MILRVFPERTKATPIDEYTMIGDPGLFIPDNITEVHISVCFSWHLKEAERLLKAWERIAPVKIGGPATGMVGGDFTPGLYLRTGYVITSRGCSNKCWFCSVWKRDGNIRELKINRGNNILDDNFLACSDEHIKKVFDMLEGQKNIKFSGGLEAARLKDWHIDRLSQLKISCLYFAYDTEDDYEPLVDAAKRLHESGFRRQRLFVYCLIGYHGDTFEKAKIRLEKIVSIGMSPYAMLYRAGEEKSDPEWKKFQREWLRPAIVFRKK